MIRPRDRLPLSRREMLGATLGLGAVATVAATSRTHAAYTVPDDEFGASFRARVERAGLPGAAMALVVRGAAPRLLACGDASLPFRVPVDGSTLFHAGSVGKHVTAAAVLRLVDAGRVDLDAGIGTYVPEVPTAWRAAPVATLLSHTSGIPDYAGDIVWDRPLTRSTFFAGAQGRALDFEPASAWWYCNAAYTLLGYLIENVAGESYATCIAELFRRAGLRDSRADAAETVIPMRAEPYVREKGVWQHATPMSTSLSSVAAGGVLMSARDMPAWHAALSGDALLSPSSRARVAAPFRLRSGRLSPYNMGWMHDALPDARRFFWHTGSVSGFRCCHFRAPQAGVACMFFTNGETDEHAAIMFEPIEAAAPGLTPYGLRPIADDDPALTRADRALLLREAAPDRGRFAPELQVLIDRFGDDAIERVHPALDTSVAFELVQQDQFDADRRRRYRLTCGSRRLHFAVARTRAGLIHDIRRL